MTDIECMDRLDMKFPDKITEEQQKMFYAYIKKERENYVLDFEDVIHFHFISLTIFQKHGRCGRIGVCMCSVMNFRM